MKFGGTSLATPDSRRLVLGHIRRCVEEGYGPVVVVSAMGRRGDVYATDTLLELLRAEGEPVAGRDEDMIFQCGEIISAALMAHLLKLSGLPAVALTGGQARIYTDGRPRRARIAHVDPSRMLYHIERGEIPVVAGGQGVTVDEGDVNILGRGASDMSGVAVGVAVGAERVEIYSDVPGIAVADPRVVSQARYLRELSYEHMYEMAIYGAKVIHPDAVRIGQLGCVPIVCRSTFSDDKGTTITHRREEPVLLGIPMTQAVDLVSVTCDNASLPTRQELNEGFAATLMRVPAEGTAMIAVLPEWRKSLEVFLASRGARAEQAACGVSLVSIIGGGSFIRNSVERVSLLLEKLAVKLVFSELSYIRNTYVVPHDQSSLLVNALYEAFA